MFDRFTTESRKIMGAARQVASDTKCGYIGSEHILLGIASIVSPARDVLIKAGLSKDVIEKEVNKRDFPKASTPLGQIPFTPNAKKVLEEACNQAHKLKAKVISPSCLLLGIITARCMALQALILLQTDLNALDANLQRIVSLGLRVSEKEVIRSFIKLIKEKPEILDRIEERLDDDIVGY